jgi:hypothetical protein
MSFYIALKFKWPCEFNLPLDHAFIIGRRNETVISFGKNYEKVVEGAKEQLVNLNVAGCWVYRVEPSSIDDVLETALLAFCFGSKPYDVSIKILEEMSCIINSNLNEQTTS